MGRASVTVLLLVFLSMTTLGSCVNPPAQLETASEDYKFAQLNASLQDYREIVDGELPEDLRLTIYYIRPSIVTRKPLSVEDLVNTCTHKIVIDAENLAKNQAALKELPFSVLQPVKETYYLNARLYYVFEVDETSTILEVAMWGQNESVLGDYCVYVNGVAVEEHPALLELINPFLTEEMRNMVESDISTE